MPENKTAIKYYDIGLNLFCRQFPDPEKVIQDAMTHGVCCILTGTDPKENQKIDDFVRNHLVWSCRKLTAQSKLSEKLEKSRFLHFKFEQ